ncbi:MAG TPA: LysM peptidoglycan-binding domain-containing protein [Gallionella sp.]|nr:LysM peptidoglycan-binding domain-containing protein [Gallionella sp.]
MRKIISLFCFLLPALAFAAQPDTRPEIRSDAPDRHIVVKGDTLWDISAMFFKDPWKWPYIWGMNKESIKDPHWIYPGEVIVLDRTTGTLRVGEAAVADRNVVKLSPKAREGYSDHDVIPSIPARVIEPFLNQPLVVDEKTLSGAPTLVALHEGRVILGTDDIGYAKGLTAAQGNRWQIYRPGKTFVDPDTNEILGREAIYLGDAEVKEFGNVSTVAVTKAVLEINQGDHLVAPSNDVSGNYLPRAPETNISARVISVYGGVSQAGQNTVVTLNKGGRDGLQSGHVLALYSKGKNIKDGDKTIALPDERYGLLFVFRVFDKVSYALVMQTRLPVQLLDRAQTP